MLNNETIEHIARRFVALSEPQRLRILQVLETGEKSVGEIVDALLGNQSNISRHLQALHRAGLLHRRQLGNSVLYSIADPMIFKLCALVCRDVAPSKRPQRPAKPTKKRG